MLVVRLDPRGQPVGSRRHGAGIFLVAFLGWDTVEKAVNGKESIKELGLLQ
jgi:hypothetical protein